MATKCKLCDLNEATQKNSHIIPSFIVSSIFSYDGSGKRDKEVMVTMTSHLDKFYIGALPSTKIEELFDSSKLTDERISNELSKNPMSKDYIFCPNCEKKISKYIETPYAESLYKNKGVDKFISFYFWLSVVWRLSLTGILNFRLSSDIEDKLGKSLNEYLSAIDRDANANISLMNTPFKYKILYYAEYKPNEPALFYVKYVADNNLLILLLGKFVICAKFDDTEILAEFNFLGLEEKIKKSPFNNGENRECMVKVESEEYNLAIIKFKEECKVKKLQSEKDYADKYWGLLRKGEKMPEEIFLHFMNKLYSNDTNIGDKMTEQRYFEKLKETFNDFGLVEEQ